MTVLTQKIHKGSKSYVQDEGTNDLISRSMSYLKLGYPVHFTGPSGTGKTSLALTLAKKRRRPVMLMHGNHELNNSDLIGDFIGYSSKQTVDNYVRSVYKKDEQVTENWRDGRLLEAVKNGYTLVYDEFTRSEPTTNNLFLSILEEGIVPLYGSKRTEPFIRVHPEFRMIFTSNPSEYAGVYKTQDALLDRFVERAGRHRDKFPGRVSIVARNRLLQLLDLRPRAGNVPAVRFGALLGLPDALQRGIVVCHESSSKCPVFGYTPPCRKQGGIRSE